MIPKFTSPATKLIRTTEGILAAGFSLAMLVVPIVSNALPPATAAKYGGIVIGVTVVGRSLLKAVIGWQTPMMPAEPPPPAPPAAK